MDSAPMNATPTTHALGRKGEPGDAPSLLALVDASGGDMGATLLRLAHRAAAQHRLAVASQHQAIGGTRGDSQGATR
ncbi:MAG: hypothetical protein AAGA29_05355 [Planctomycetota bacterium]